MEINDQNFQAEVLDYKDGLVLVDFYAVWCGPCQMYGPILEELAKEMEGKVKIVKVNVDESPQTAGKYGVMSIPTTIILQDGEVKETMMGVQNKEVLKEKLDGLL